MVRLRETLRIKVLGSSVSAVSIFRFAFHAGCIQWTPPLASGQLCITHLSLITRQWVFFGGSPTASQGRALLARLSKTLYREDGRARWLARESGERFRKSQVCVAYVTKGGKSSMNIGVWLAKKQRQLFQELQASLRANRILTTSGL